MHLSTLHCFSAHVCTCVCAFPSLAFSWLHGLVVNLESFDFVSVLFNTLGYWLTRRASFCSFMPTHIGAETDLRFVYCAGEEHCYFYMLIIDFF
jgi:hypothetical protein